MSRPLRIEYEGAWYHVMNRGRRKEVIFFDDEDRKEFCDMLAKASRLYEIEIHAYSLMPNHYHILIFTPNGNLSRAMRYINGVYTQRINQKHKYEGSLFKGRFKSILIEEEAYFLELLRYIHRNPVKAKLVENVIDHKWTSHRAYMINKERPEWLKTGVGISKFGKYEKTAKRKLNAYVERQMPKDLETMLDRVKWPVILGGDKFKKMIKEKFQGEKIPNREVSQYREIEKEKTAEEFKEILVNKCKLYEEGVFKRSKKRKYTEKKMAYTYVCREGLHLSIKEISESLGKITSAAVSKYYASAVDKLRNSQSFKTEIDKLVKTLS